MGIFGFGKKKKKQDELDQAQAAKRAHEQAAEKARAEALTGEQAPALPPSAAPPTPTDLTQAEADMKTASQAALDNAAYQEAAGPELAAPLVSPPIVLDEPVPEKPRPEGKPPEPEIELVSRMEPEAAEEPPAPEAAAPAALPVPEEKPPAPKPAPAASDWFSEGIPDKPAVRPKYFMDRVGERLSKTRDKIGGSIERISLGKKIDDEVLDELEEVLVTADMGVPTATRLIEGLRGKVRRKELDDTEALKKALAAGIAEVFQETSSLPERTARPHVLMVVGVNGVGKTTTIGKLAHNFQAQGRKVLLAAGDTFRAAAAEQLTIWAQRVGCEIVSQRHGADPSAVAYDAVEAAVKRGMDIVIIDTAGRLHTKVNLMEELKKIHRVVGKVIPEAPHEVMLVLDATTGQNAISQAKLFHEAVALDDIVLTKLDGTAKGGVVVGIAAEMKLPIAYVGLGEGIDDLKPFDPREFAEAVVG